MKCIEKHGVIKRVKDEVASNMVEEGNTFNKDKGWAYCSKSKWKEATRKKDPKNAKVKD